MSYAKITGRLVQIEWSDLCKWKKDGVVHRSRPTTGCGARSTSCGSTGTSSGNCQETETCMVRACPHATTASPKPSFRAPWRMGDAVVGRGNAGWTTPQVGHICPCQNRSWGPPAEQTRRGSLLNHPSCPLDDPIGQATELNRTELSIGLRYWDERRRQQLGGRLECRTGEQKWMHIFNKRANKQTASCVTKL